MSTYEVVVIGGGPAGMMAAAVAAERGKKVLLLEKNKELGKKLLMTGGGRCNVTNNKKEVREMLAKYTDAREFLFSAFSQHAVSESIAFFEKRGVPLREEHEGRLFPVSNTARSIHEVLVKYMEAGKVTVRTTAVVREVRKEDDLFTLTLMDGTTLSTPACVLATGGTSRPETGSTGDGFRFLETMGHTVTKHSLALVPLALSDVWVKKVAGISLPAVKLTVFSDGKKESVEHGKLLFTHVGVTGPTILNMSKAIGELLEYSEVVITVNLFPQMDTGTLRSYLQTVLAKESNKKIKNALAEMMPGALASVILDLLSIEGDTPSHSVRSEDRKRIVTILEALPLRVSGLLGRDKAVVSGGGVTLSEINFKTMESRIVPGLYVVGDVLNIDRPSGGYSLQLCWTTGYVAGMHA